MVGQNFKIFSTLFVLLIFLTLKRTTINKKKRKKKYKKFVSEKEVKFITLIFRNKTFEIKSLYIF